MCGLPWPTRAPARLADVLGASWLYVVDVTNCLDRVLLLNTTTVVSLGGREGGREVFQCVHLSRGGGRGLVTLRGGDDVRCTMWVTGCSSS